MPRYQNYHVWIESDILLLRSEAALKKTASQIALNWKDVSRAAVLYQCTRLHIKLLWERKTKKKPKNPGQHGPLSINFEKRYIPLLPEPFPIKNPISFTSRPHDCCSWIVGDPRKLLCCPDKAMENKPYCEAHCKISYVPTLITYINKAA